MHVSFFASGKEVTFFRLPNLYCSFYTKILNMIISFSSDIINYRHNLGFEEKTFYE
jgi:hypothetical protein